MQYSDNLSEHKWNQTGSRFESGDRVRVSGVGDEMRVVLAWGDYVHCEWLTGTELQQRRFLASVLRLVERPSR
jgi:hypothetical protein